ncbi:hypothetical protein SteCoe_2695 [Stentor coeruleus]|uniref:Transmembrane protein n=1 Tax=Stentor coeruleus TaxID=5963 RepID=A0A1R2CYX8_9CILI|nr:hypothetical protein SteCoe_2695 [Stentor coeruleus]
MDLQQDKVLENDEIKDIIHDESPEIILENAKEDTERNANPFAQLVMLPPIFLADPNFTFPDNSPMFSPEQQNKLDLTLVLSRKICWLSIIDCILISFILYYKIYYLIFVVIFLPVIGFIGSRRFSMKLCIFYLFYLFSVIALRIILLAINFAIPVMIIQLLIVLLELYIIYLDAKFIKMIKNLSSIERDYLQGRRFFQRGPEHIPNDVAVKVLETPPNVYHSFA